MPQPNRSAAAAKLPTGNSAITNSPLSRWDGNTATGRRIRDLYRGYELALGNPVDVATQALILGAAETIAIAETARADHIAGKVDLNAVVRAEGMAARALRRVGLSKVAVTKPAAPSIHDIARRYASATATPSPVGDGA